MICLEMRVLFIYNSINHVVRCEMRSIKKCVWTGVILAVFVIGGIVCNYGIVHAEQVNIVQERPDLNILIHGNLGDYADIPIMINERTLLPLRAIIVELGVPNDDDHIIWNSEERSVRINNGGKDIKLVLDHPVITVNDKQITMDVCPVIYKSRTYIPARFIAESLGMKVAWDGATQTVAIGSEENYIKVKELLENNHQAIKNSEKFKVVQTYDSKIMNKFLSVENVVEYNYVTNFTVNNPEEKCLAALSIVSNNNGVKNKLEIEIWIDKNDIYIRQKPSNIWQQPILTNEEIQSEKKKCFDVYYFLEPTDFNCTALNISPTETKGQLKLYGEFFPSELMKLIMENASIDKDLLLFYFDESTTEILIDQATSIASDVHVKTGKHVGGETFYLDSNFDLKWSILELNGDFEVELPDSISAGKDNSISEADELLNNGMYDEAVKAYSEVIRLEPDNYLAYFGRAIAEYFLGKYDSSIKDLDKAIELNKNESDLYVWKAKNHIMQENYESAVKLCDQALIQNNRNDFAYNIKGYALSRMGKYSEALECVEEAISIDSEYEDAYLNKVSILYFQKKYLNCIEFGKKIKNKFPDNYDIPWYVADSYIALYDYENALKMLQEVLGIVPDSIYANVDTAWCYYYIGDYGKSEEYVNKALELDRSNSSAKILKQYLEEQKLPESERIANFVRNNYLYLDKVKDFEKKTNEFIAKKKVTAKDIEEYINAIKLKDDMFTYVISGDNFDDYKNFEKENHLYTHKLDNTTYYVGILGFTPTVGIEFINYVESIDNPEDVSLIIDLRNNSGGLLKPSNDILDYLLPKCITSYCIDRNGKIYTYYSDEGKVNFKHIYILVNQYSASSSELLALGLKTYLQNVTIIGQPTVGKGVGQNVYVSNDGKYMIYLVNFYWNVKEQNIMGSRITPDIIVEGDDIKDYLKYVK